MKSKWAVFGEHLCEASLAISRRRRTRRAYKFGNPRLAASGLGQPFTRAPAFLDEIRADEGDVK